MNAGATPPLPRVRRALAPAGGQERGENCGQTPAAQKRGTGRQLPPGHVTGEQLKADVARGLDYFWSRRPHLHQPGVDAAGFTFRRKPAV